MHRLCRLGSVALPARQPWAYSHSGQQSRTTTYGCKALHIAARSAVVRSRLPALVCTTSLRQQLADRRLHTARIAYSSNSIPTASNSDKPAPSATLSPSTSAKPSDDAPFLAPTYDTFYNTSDTHINNSQRPLYKSQVQLDKRSIVGSPYGFKELQSRAGTLVAMWWAMGEAALILFFVSGVGYILWTFIDLQKIEKAYRKTADSVVNYQLPQQQQQNKPQVQPQQQPASVQPSSQSVPTSITVQSAPTGNSQLVFPPQR